MVNDFAPRLVTWFDQHGRKNLPWQQDAGAYGIWVSEIMLQQTQVQTVIPYYERFMASFPDVVALADAHQDDVLGHWSGLGYYARARNLHTAAREVRDRFDGVVPTEFDDIVALPGVGRSTAGAILALAFGRRQAILDGNVKRVIARHEAVNGWPGRTAVANSLWEIAETYTPNDRVADYTQAIMDLGATVCTRRAPGCSACPVSDDCQAFLANSIEQYPGRKPRKEKPLKRTTMVLAVNHDNVYLERRPSSGIWGGLWSLPEVEDPTDWCTQKFEATPQRVESWKKLRHSFSHYDLDIDPVVVRIDRLSSTVADQSDTIWHAIGSPPPGGIAAPVQKLINELEKVSDGTHG